MAPTESPFTAAEQHGIARRSTAWAALGAVFVAYLAITALPADPASKLRAAAVLYPLPSLLATVAAVRATRATAGKEFRQWRLVAFSMGAFFVGSLTRSLYLFTQHGTPPPGSLEDVAYLIGFVCFVPVVLLMTEPFEVVSTRKVRNALDFASMVVWTLVIVYLFVLLPARALTPGIPAPLFAVELGYPVLTISFALYLLSFKRGAWKTGDELLTAGLAFAAVGTVADIVGMARGFYVPGTFVAGLVDAGWLLAYGFIGMGAVYAATETDKPHRITRPELDLPHWPGIAALSLALVGIPLLIYVSARLADPRSEIIVSASAALLAVLVVLRSAAIAVENRRLASQSLVDPLTGLFNHRHFRDQLALQSQLAVRESEPLSLALLEIDGFDRVNRVQGYAAGDRRLQAVGSKIAQAVRSSDACFRLGGDKFAVLMPATDAVEAYVMASRVIDELELISDGVPMPLSLSVGIASLPLHTLDADELVRFADGAVYWAKSHDGGQTVVYDPQVVDALNAGQRIQQIEQASHTSMVEVLAAAVDARDPYTEFHSRNVAAFAEKLAIAAGLPEEHAKLVHSAGLLHDVGKIGIPDDILLKPGRLDDAECTRIREHPALGVRILQASTRRELLPWIAAHHERWDGTGYPKSLTADKIPFESRILSICDAFDAMTTDRPYRRALELDDALEELDRGAATQFDPELVRLFQHLVREGVVSTSPHRSRH